MHFSHCPSGVQNCRQLRADPPPRISPTYFPNRPKTLLDRGQTPHMLPPSTDTPHNCTSVVYCIEHASRTCPTGKCKCPPLSTSESTAPTSERTAILEGNLFRVWTINSGTILRNFFQRNPRFDFRVRSVQKICLHVFISCDEEGDGDSSGSFRRTVHFCPYTVSKFPCKKNTTDCRSLRRGCRALRRGKRFPRRRARHPPSVLLEGNFHRSFMAGLSFP